MRGGLWTLASPHQQTWPIKTVSRGLIWSIPRFQQPLASTTTRWSVRPGTVQPSFSDVFGRGVQSRLQPEEVKELVAGNVTVRSAELNEDALSMPIEQLG